VCTRLRGMSPLRHWGVVCPLLQVSRLDMSRVGARRSVRPRHLRMRCGRGNRMRSWRHSRHRGPSGLLWSLSSRSLWWPRARRDRRRHRGRLSWGGAHKGWGPRSPSRRLLRPSRHGRPLRLATWSDGRSCGVRPRPHPCQRRGSRTSPWHLLGRPRHGSGSCTRRVRMGLRGHCRTWARHRTCAKRGMRTRPRMCTRRGMRGRMGLRMRMRGRMRLRMRGRMRPRRWMQHGRGPCHRGRADRRAVLLRHPRTRRPARVRRRSHRGQRGRSMAMSRSTRCRLRATRVGYGAPG